MSGSSKAKTALGLLLREFLPHKSKIAIVVALGLVVSLVQPLSVKIVESIIDDLQRGVTQRILTHIPMVLILIFTLSGAAKFFYNTARRSLTEIIVVKLRAALFEKYLTSSMYQMNQRRTGDLLSMMQNDLAQVHNGISTVYDLLKEPFTLMGLLAVAFYCDWRLATLTILVLPIAGYFFARSGRAIKTFSAKNMDQFSELVSLGQESITGSPIIKVFRLEKLLVGRFQKIQQTYFHSIWRAIQIQEIATPAVEFIGAVLMAGILYYGGTQILHGEMTSGTLIAFVLSIGLSQMPLKSLNDAFLRLKNAEAAAERLYQILDAPNSLHSIDRGKVAFNFDKQISFKGVGLTYDDRPVLEEISFVVPKNSTVAFVGLSGSGKSSILHLVPRLYDVTEGAIEIDGTNIKDLSLSSLRDHISLVTQDTFLFYDSIYENIRHGRPDATEEEILRAAELAYCNEFLLRFPRGIHTKVGERGSLLSGGERQRVSIARALLKNSPILLLDEATSNLDSHSERMVQKALETLVRGRTTFVVAHRMSTIESADQIFVLDDGKIVEFGSHTALIEQQGTYANLRGHKQSEIRVDPVLV